MAKAGSGCQARPNWSPLPCGNHAWRTLDLFWQERIAELRFWRASSMQTAKELEKENSGKAYVAIAGGWGSMPF